MKKFFIVACSFLSYFNGLHAQNTEDHRLLIILDASENMKQPWNDKKTYYQTASQFINYLADSIYATNPNVKIAIRTYGHLSPASLDNCKDSRREIIFGKNNSTQIELRLLDIKPKGKPALGHAIEEAGKYDLLPTPEPIHCNSVLFVTASASTCDENFCSLSKTILEKRITGKQYVVSLKDDAQMQIAYACLGNYLPVTDNKNLHQAVATIASFYETDKVNVEETETIQKPIAEVANDPVINAYKTFREDPVVDTTKKTYIMFTSGLQATDISLQIQDYRSYKPYVTDIFVLPMSEKRAVASARYRVYYTITKNGAKEKRIKEFYARMNKDNTIDLD